jgi:ABC-type transport system involved in multi-copper enzyme maturation permease subunit
VFDKEMRSEIFAQGTLMLRVVIQVSMLLAIPLMAWLLYLQPWNAPWYASYVILFNMLVGPVFSAGSVTSERERQTLELLLTTTLSPAQILWPKLVSGLRVSSVLTMFLVWPLVLAVAMVDTYWSNLPAVLGYVAIVLVVCLTTATLALAASVLFHKTSISLMTTYLVLAVLFLLPPAATFFAATFFPDATTAALVEQASFTSPFSVALNLPIDAGSDEVAAEAPNWRLWGSFVAFYAGLDAALVAAMTWLFSARWRMEY